MLMVKNSEIKWINDEKHDMYAGIHEDLPKNKSADVIFAKILPNHELPLHWHKRPLDIDGKNVGYESFFFYNGGHILLVLSDGTIEYNTDEPFTLTFFSGEKEAHGIKNISEKSVEFQVLCAPCFDENEEYFK